MDEYDDDPLVRALRAPGTPGELGGEAAALRAYRQTFATPGRARRAVGRVGLGSSALVLSLSLGGGVAAAYTQALPDRVQDFAHGVLGPVGVPPAEVREPRRVPDTAAPGGPDTASAPTDPQTSPSAGSTSPEPGETTSAAPDGGPSSSPPSGQPSQPEPSQPTAPATGEPSSPSTSDPASAGAAAVSITVSASRVGPDQTVTVSGTVTDDAGGVVAGRTVRLLARTADGTWSTVATQRSAEDGLVSFTSPPVTETVALRLVVRGRVASDTVRVSLRPVLTVSSAGAPGAPATVTVSALGAQPGDTVVLVELDTGAEVGRGRLADDGSVSFDVRPAGGRTVYVARLLASPRHGSAEGRVTVGSSREGEPVDPSPTTDPTTPPAEPEGSGEPVEPEAPGSGDPAAP